MTNCCNFDKTGTQTDILLVQIKREIDKIITDTTARLLVQDGKIAETCVYIKDNLSNEIRVLLDTMQNSGELDDIITKTVISNAYMASLKTDHIITPQMFGAVGDGITDDTKALQTAIDIANKKNRCVEIPCGKYKISKSILLNGCTIKGQTGNIFGGIGTVIICENKSFTAIKQGSTSTNDIMFNVSDIIVQNAETGYEFNYVVNSEFERLYAIDCGVGFRLGNGETVGSMFCKFNGLYTQNCDIGIESNSRSYFNNNEFNNGFIFGNDYAMSLNVSGGYGAVGNVFNNVEFRSNNGRGIILTSCQNTVFNSCYFENGSNSIHCVNHCTLAINNCTFGVFKKENTYNDVNIVYTAGGASITIDGGIIFLNEEYNDITFYGAGNPATHENIYVLKPIHKNGTASGFKFFDRKVKSIAIEQEEQTSLTGTIVATAGQTTDVPFTYELPFTSIPNVTLATMRGASGVGGGLSYVISERTSTGGIISVTNTGNVDRSISFSVYAKLF